MATVSQALKETVQSMPHIGKVHFNKAGGHYFHVHEFGGKGKKYGFLKLEKTQVGKDANNRPIFKQKPVANPAAEVVETLSRDQILNAK